MHFGETLVTFLDHNFFFFFFCMCSGVIQRMLLNADPKKIRHVPRDNVLALEAVCQETGGLSAELQGGLGFIYPGTKWCGPGKYSHKYKYTKIRSELPAMLNHTRLCTEVCVCCYYGDVCLIACISASLPRRRRRRYRI